MTGRSAISSIILIVAVAAALSACGRKGPLELPPAGVVTDEHGRTQPAPKPVQDKPFILDRLIP